MNSLIIVVLKIIRRIYLSTFSQHEITKPECIRNPDISTEIIYELLISYKPTMIARFGANELNCIANFISVKKNQKPWFLYIQGRSHSWWWNQNVIEQIQNCAGFFPADIPSVERFCALMLKDIPLVDLLGSWLPDEYLFDKELENSPKVDLELLNPYFSTTPWTRALEGKKVLVIHPFADTVKAQYLKRELIFANNLLPAFELKTLKAVQSIAGETTEFDSWFSALEHMKNQMDQIDYDICLIGCGAYGFPLAAHAKRMGKKGFHLGGSLQLLFGIRGKRWENPNYNPDYNFSTLMNEHWVKPSNEERPEAAHQVEGACYW